MMATLSPAVSEATVAPYAISKRLVTEHDTLFIFELFKTTRAWEMSLVDWSAAQKEVFLQQQFEAQKIQYQRNYPQGEHNLLLLNNEPIGRIYTATCQNEIQLLDILLAPNARNKGIGSLLMGQLKARARQASIPLRFYVWQLNHAAQRFYQRHNCVVIGEAGAYIHMEWNPE